MEVVFDYFVAIFEDFTKLFYWNIFIDKHWMPEAIFGFNNLSDAGNSIAH